MPVLSGRGAAARVMLPRRRTTTCLCRGEQGRSAIPCCGRKAHRIAVRKTRAPWTRLLERKRGAGEEDAPQSAPREQVLGLRPLSPSLTRPSAAGAGERHLGPTGELPPRREAPAAAGTPGSPEPPGREAALGRLPAPSGRGLPPFIITRMSARNREDLASDIELNP